MAQVKRGVSVSIHYTGRFNDGIVFDTSRDREPLNFTLGSNEILPGFEHVLGGMKPGETRLIKVSGEQAYGPHLPERVLHVKRGQIEPDIAMEIGLMVHVGSEGGRASEYRVVEVVGDEVTLDGTHPLAGKELFLRGGAPQRVLAWIHYHIWEAAR